MSYHPETPFDNIESGQEYVDLLLEAIQEAQRDVDAEIAVTAGRESERRRQALQLVAHNLGKLSMHVSKSRRILNDLRTLRRLLLEERGVEASEERSRVVGAG